MTAKINQISWRDAEDLEAFAGQLLGIGIRAFGMEPMGSPSNEPPSYPAWFDSFDDRSNSARARAIWRRLIDATNLYSPASTVLVALHSPAAVACDGTRGLSQEEVDRCNGDRSFRARDRLDVGRRLAVYPCTCVASEARLWRTLREERIAVEQMCRGLSGVSGAKGKPGPRKREPLDTMSHYLSPLNGQRPPEVLRAMALAKASAKGAEADLWREIDREACMLIEGSARAWNEMPTHRAGRQILQDRPAVSA